MTVATLSVPLHERELAPLAEELVRIALHTTPEFVRDTVRPRLAAVFELHDNAADAA